MMGPPGANVSMMYGFLLNTPTVQKELELVDEQKAKIKELGEKAMAAMREMRAGMGSMRDPNLSEDERRAKGEEMGKKMQAQMEAGKKAIEEILLPHQLERLKGIALQRAGIEAINDKQIQQDLKLSDEQVAKIKSIGEEAGKKFGALFSEGADRETIGPKMQEIGKDRAKQLTDVLTEDQRATLEKMKGEKLEIPASELRGPGGFGGPGGERRRPPAKKAD
jgi:hypothetical protein